MKHIPTFEEFLNESSNAKGPGFKTINKSYPQHIKVLKKLYLVWDDDAEWYDWSDKPGKKMNGELKKGEEFFFSHIFKPNNVAADGINYKDKNGKHGPEFVPYDLERLVHDNAIEIVESVQSGTFDISKIKPKDTIELTNTRTGDVGQYTVKRIFGGSSNIKEIELLNRSKQPLILYYSKERGLQNFKGDTYK
jgi:hypothetical protein